MIKNELQLKKIIKNILTERYEIVDAIEVYSNDIDAAIEDTAPNEDTIKKAIRRNNVLLEIILILVETKSEKFTNFYTKSKIEINDNFKKEEFNRGKDLAQIKNYVENFVNEIKNTDSLKKFMKALNSLKNNLSDYKPKWTILQYLFLNINSKNDFKEYIEDVSNNDSNWQTVKNKQGVEIRTVQVLTNVFRNSMSDSIIKIINESSLDENDKKEILSNNVSSSSFMKGIKRGEWNWLTDTIDDTVKFFFPNLSSITDEIENWFDDIGRALGKDPDSNENWLIDYIKDNPEIKKYLNKLENGDDINQDEFENILKSLEDDSDSKE